MLSTIIGLMRGIPTKIAAAVAVTGTSQSNPFSVTGVPGASGVVILQAIGTFTALAGNVEASEDGGTTYQTYVAFDFTTGIILTLTNMTPGIVYRLNFTTVTKTVPPDVFASLS